MRSFAPSSRCWSSSAVTSPMKYKDGQVQQKQTMVVNMYLKLPKKLVCLMWLCLPGVPSRLPSLIKRYSSSLRSLIK